MRRQCLAWEEHELPSGRFARFAAGADIVSWICRLVGARDDEHAFAMAARQRLPTRSLSGILRVAGRDCVAVSPQAAGVLYEAPTKKLLKYCGDELDPKSRTLLDYHPVEVARQMALVVRADFCARAIV
jgi:hypothetical protein